MGSEKKQSAEMPEGKWVRIEHIVPGDLRSLFANHIVVQSSGGNFFLSFFEIIQPIVLAEDKKMVEHFQKVKSTPAKCIARLVVSKKLIPNIISSLASHYQRYLEQKESNETSDDEKQ